MAEHAPKTLREEIRPRRRLGCTPPAGPAPRGRARPERAGERRPICAAAAALPATQAIARPPNRAPHVESSLAPDDERCSCAVECGRRVPRGVTRQTRDLAGAPQRIGSLVTVDGRAACSRSAPLCAVRPLAATTSQFQRYDEGIWLSAVALLDRGQLPLADLLRPRYGWGYALPGLPSRWLFRRRGIRLGARRITVAVEDSPPAWRASSWHVAGACSWASAWRS